MQHFKELKPGDRFFVRAYLSVMLWFTGRAIQAAAKVDKTVAEEFAALPDGFTMVLQAAPDGPAMVVGKDEKGVVRYKGSNSREHPVDVAFTTKSMEFLFLLFTFRESTPIASARNRLFVEGALPQACAAVRILDIVQVYLLPKPIAKLAVKRYPQWGLKRHTIDRLMVNIRAIIGR